MPSEIKVFLYDEEGPIHEIVDWGDYRLGYYLRKGMLKSGLNDDVVFVYGNKDSVIFGVADGAGGHPRGQEAAKIVAERVLYYYSKNKFEDVRVLDVIEDINDKVLDLKVGARTTVAMGSIFNDDFRSFSVGDSEIIYWNNKATVIYSNIPQSQVGYSIEAGHIQQEDSLDEPDRYVVDNMIGDVSIRIEASSKLNLKKGHTILIGSDGIFDNLSHERLSSILAKGSFEDAFNEMCAICENQDPELWKKDDDISFVVLRRTKAEKKEP